MIRFLIYFIIQTPCKPIQKNKTDIKGIMN